MWQLYRTPRGEIVCTLDVFMIKVFASLLLCCSATSLMAADMQGPSGALRGSIDAWSGVYAAASVGYDQISDTNGLVTDYGSGSIYGAVVGYNHQIGEDFVVGVEADFNQYDIPFTKASFISVVDVVSARARVGFVLGDAMIYATAGIVYGTTNINLEDVGRVVGVGVDYKLTDYIFAGVNYQHINFRNFDNAGINANLDSVRARVGFHF